MRATCFRVEPFLEAAFILCASDEFMRARQLLKNLPAWYRDNPPPEVVEMLRQIDAGLMTQRDYMQNANDLHLIDRDRAKGILNGTTRGLILKQIVTKLNEQKLVPHIGDMGPGDFWMAVGLNEEKLKFTYHPYSIHPEAEAKAREILGDAISYEPWSADRPSIFVACEIIEHLHYEEEIRMTYEKFGGNASYLLMSTPLYTFGNGNDNWQDPKQAGLLGHLRAYTPSEMEVSIRRLFPEFKCQFITDNLINVFGVGASAPNLLAQ